MRRYATFLADCPAIPALAEETAAATVQDDAPARRIGCRNRIFAIVNACSNAWNVAVAVSSMALERNGCGYAMDHLGGLRFGRLTGEPSFALAAALCTPPASLPAVFSAQRPAQSPWAVKSPDCRWPCINAGLTPAQKVFGHLPYKLQLDST